MSVYLCYVDESGTPEVPGNTSHYVLSGLAIPIEEWKACDAQINGIKAKFALDNEEIHVAWLLRPYREQNHIPNFERLDYPQRKSAVDSLRTADLLRLQRAKNRSQYRQTQKNYRETEKYVHLSSGERRSLVEELANTIARWKFARLFAECIDKINFDPIRASKTVEEQAFEQLVSRFERYLKNVGEGNPFQAMGMLIHDSNQTVAVKHTNLMKRYYQTGTLWTDINCIIETPLFVDSELTSMIQIADLCSYALRRYLENAEDNLFDMVFQRAYRKDEVVVSVRHFTKPNCTCKICSAHRRR